MAETLGDLHDREAVELQRQAHAQQMLGRQRAQADTAKVMATFAQAVAATLVATSLQVAPTAWPDTLATVLLGLGFLLAIATVLVDRVLEPRYTAIDSGYTDGQKLRAMRTLVINTALDNEHTVRLVKQVAGSCVVVSLAAGVTAAVALLVGGP